MGDRTLFRVNQAFAAMAVCGWGSNGARKIIVYRNGKEGRGGEVRATRIFSKGRKEANNVY